MDKKQMKIVGIICLVASAAFIFVAIERYNTNAKKVKAIKQMMNRGSSPLGGVMNKMTVNVKAKAPPATIYAILFAVMSGAAGAVLLVISKVSSNAENQNHQEAAFE